MKPSTRSLALLLAALGSASCARHSGDVATVVLGPTPVFETRIEVQTGSAVHTDFAVADFDGDGKVDMAVISLTGELRILLGNGTAFTLGQADDIGGGPLWMATGDFDNDGAVDLVIVRREAETLDLWRNNGSAVFTVAATLAIGPDALAVSVGDLDGDGNLDVAVSRPSIPEVLIGFGDGAGGFAAEMQISLPGGGMAFNLAIGRVLRDPALSVGKGGPPVDALDLVIADPDLDRLLVFPGGPRPWFGTEFFTLSVPNAPSAVAFGDLSGDGFDDLVVSVFTANHYVVITDILFGEQPEGGALGYQSFLVPVTSVPSIATVADVTGDGRPDLIGCLGFTASMVVAPGLPGGGVGEQFQLDTSGLPLRPLVADADGDGKNDLFVLSGGGNRVNLWLARPNGQLVGARNYATSLPRASWVEAADFDGDGDAEIVSGSWFGTELALLGATPAGDLQIEAVLDIGLPIQQLKAGDLDGDGRADLVIGVPGGVKLLRNRSTPGTYEFELLPQLLATVGTGEFPFGIALADLDRDGDIDIAFCDFLGGSVHIVPGTPQPFVYGAERVVQLGGGPVDLVAADFTGDGLLDLAVSRNTTSDIQILRNLGGLEFESFLTVPVGAQPNYLVSADFNRDGRADLVVSNAAAGTVSVLFGSPTGFSGQAYLAGTAPTALLARDLNGDGLVDILVASLVSGDFRVLVGDGRGNFPQLPRFPGTPGASDAVLQDMTGDGRPDLIVASLISNRLSLVRNATVASQP